jgi:flagellar basal body-associated protein FliL
MKTVFISASPVLVNEVNRFYTHLRDSIINHLKQKELESLRAQKAGQSEPEVSDPE